MYLQLSLGKVPDGEGNGWTLEEVFAPFTCICMYIVADFLLKHRVSEDLSAGNDVASKYSVELKWREPDPSLPSLANQKLGQYLDTYIDARALR